MHPDMSEQEFRDQYCYCCHREYESTVGTFSDNWACDECGAPICSLCWITGMRYCDDHGENIVDDRTKKAGEESADPADDAGSDDVPEADLVEETPESRTEEDDPDPTPVEPRDVTESDESVPELAEESSAPVSVDEGDVPEEAVTRRECKNREEAFISRVESKFGSRFGVFHPGEGRWLDMSKNNVEVKRRAKTDSVKSEVQSLLDENYREVFQQMPVDRSISWYVFTRKFFGGRSLKVVMAAAAISPWKDLVRKGYSNRKIPYARAEEVASKLNAGNNVFHYIGLFATTGWKENARQLVSNGQNYLLSLVDYRDGRWRNYQSPDGRWGDFQSVFDLNTKDEQKERILEYIRNHEFEVIMGRLSLEKAQKDLNMSESELKNSFRSVASQDPFVKFEVTPSGSRLVRTYRGS